MDLSASLYIAHSIARRVPPAPARLRFYSCKSNFILQFYVRSGSQCVGRLAERCLVCVRRRERRSQVAARFVSIRTNVLARLKNGKRNKKKKIASITLVSRSRSSIRERMNALRLPFFPLDNSFQRETQICFCSATQMRAAREANAILSFACARRGSLK